MDYHNFFESRIEKDRSSLIRALQLVQEEEGYISDEAIVTIGSYLAIPLVEIEGVVTFYAQFKRVKPGKYVISVCDGTACHIKGASKIVGWIAEELGIVNGQTDDMGLFSLETVACLGCCSLAPVIAINGKVFGNLQRKSLKTILNRYRREDRSYD